MKGSAVNSSDVCSTALAFSTYYVVKLSAISVFKKKQSNMHCPMLGTFILTLMCMWHMGDGWYTSDLHIVTTHI